jgi:hypothetical protein
VEEHRWGIDVFSYVVEPPAADYLPVTEYALFPRDLSMEELGSNGVAFTVPAEGAADSSQQDMCFWHDYVLLNMIRQRTPECVPAESITYMQNSKEGFRIALLLDYALCGLVTQYFLIKKSFISCIS